MSITFALATGVGKTRLMGAFITYLYCQYGYRNFFIVAPNLTIYNKLKSDLGDPASRKYVFHAAAVFPSRHTFMRMMNTGRNRLISARPTSICLFSTSTNSIRKTHPCAL